jgi:transketolase
MRDAFAAEIYDLARRDPSIVLLSGDIGFGVFDKFRADMPDQFVNMGVAEQNMVGVAAGLALEGRRPVVYTIIPFATMRCFEQIRVDVCMHDLPVKIVGVGGGLSYGALGPTHHATEDIAIMRALPNMRVIVPADPKDTRFLFRVVMTDPGTRATYFRLGKNGEPSLSFPGGYLGSEVTIISCGPIAKIALGASEILKARYLDCPVIQVHSIKPFPVDYIRTLIRKTDLVVTLEEHSVIGGLGSAVAEVMAEEGLPVPLVRFGIPDKFMTTVGDHDYLLAELGLTAENVAKIIEDRWHA